MSNMQENGVKPFSESMIALIRGLKSSNPYISDRQLMYGFAEVILSSEIRDGHDELIATWQTGALKCGIYYDLGVVQSIQAQKQAQGEKKLASVR